jgi:hypothetical protein
VPTMRRSLKAWPEVASRGFTNRILGQDCEEEKWVNL